MLRVVSEQEGAPENVNNIFGVAWLSLLVPFYFAHRIRVSGAARPLRLLFRNLLLFGIYTRLMVMPTYWIAYALQWPAPRFSTKLGGVVGEGVSPVSGYLLIPMRNALVWTLAAVIVGMILGSMFLRIRRGAAAAPAG